MDRKNETDRPLVGGGPHLSQRQAKELDDAHNDKLELRENARNRQLEHEKDRRREKMRELVAESAKMPPETRKELPAVNDWNTRKTLVMHGIPHPDDPSDPLRFRNASGTHLEDPANQAWGRTHEEAIAEAAREDTRRATPKRETLSERMQRMIGERGKMKVGRTGTIVVKTCPASLVSSS